MVAYLNDGKTNWFPTDICVKFCRKGVDVKYKLKKKENESLCNPLLYDGEFFLVKNIVPFIKKYHLIVVPLF